MVGVGGKHHNHKTVLSVDFTTTCQRTRAGKPCVYCYVATARINGGYMVKHVVEYEPYDGFIERLRPETVRRLNRIGGIRMFSFADYMREHADDIKAMLDDCVTIGLGAKAITKELAFIRRFHAHPGLHVINLSVDNLAETRCRSPIGFATARRYRARYPKVWIRAAVLDREDLEYFGAQRWVDILTLNHSCNGFHRFGRTEINEIARQYPGRVCCVNTTCAGCKVLCGLGQRRRVGKEASCRNSMGSRRTVYSS